MAQEERPSAAQMAELAKSAPPQVPIFNASSCKVIGTGTDFVILLERALPLISQTGGGELSQLALLQPIAMLTLSPSTVKDFSILLARTVEAFEKDFGKIVTPYTKTLETT